MQATTAETMQTRTSKMQIGMVLEMCATQGRTQQFLLQDHAQTLTLLG